jgi:very-short-patch-repair endonuclease
MFLRRRDLLGLGYLDRHIRYELGQRRIFRVRQGWYSVPDAPEAAVLAVRVGGRLTGVSALETYGLRVPRRPQLHVAVPIGACRLRKPLDRFRRLAARDPVRVHWVDRREPGGTAWRVSVADALLVVLTGEGREIAVACASAVMHHRLLTPEQLAAVFARAPARVVGWQCLVSDQDESHGETYARLAMRDAGIAFTQQVWANRHRHDFLIGERTFIEIDGGQHDPEWVGEGVSTWDADFDRDTTTVITGGTTHRFNYRQLYTDMPRVLLAIRRLEADDAVLSAYRRRHPYRPRVHRKRRRSAQKTRDSATKRPRPADSPSFSSEPD